MERLVGLTGGIGSGKSLVCSILGLCGIPVFDSDREAKVLMHRDPNLRAEIKQVFGAKSYLPDKRLNREFLASKVFNDQEKLQKLNSLVHPAVRRALSQWYNEHRDAPYLIQEAAILFESGAFHHCAKTIVVYAPRDVRIKRVVSRDGVDTSDVERRMDKQIGDTLRIAMSDYIVVNDGSTSIVCQVYDLHHKLLNNFVQKGKNQ
jgi:dephospho-CoA kinase